MNIPRPGHHQGPLGRSSCPKMLDCNKKQKNTWTSDIKGPQTKLTYKWTPISTYKEHNQLQIPTNIKLTKLSMFIMNGYWDAMQVTNTRTTIVTVVNYKAKKGSLKKETINLQQKTLSEFKIIINISRKRIAQSNIILSRRCKTE